MSEIPELDRLIEEADNVRHNTAWDWHDRLFRRSMGCAFISLLLLPVLAALFGKSGAVISMVALLLSITPVLALGVYGVLHECFTDPRPKDPTKRYKHM